jgi:hypothetical protein
VRVLAHASPHGVQGRRRHVHDGEIGEASSQELVDERGSPAAHVDRRRIGRDGETIDQLERHDCLGLVPADARRARALIHAIPVPTVVVPQPLHPAILARTAPDPPCRLGIFSATVISFTIGGWTDARACGDLRSQWLVRPFTRSGPNRKGRWSACVAAIGREPGC